MRSYFLHLFLLNFLQRKWSQFSSNTPMYANFSMEGLFWEMHAYKPVTSRLIIHNYILHLFNYFLDQDMKKNYMKIVRDIIWGVYGNCVNKNIHSVKNISLQLTATILYSNHLSTKALKISYVTITKFQHRKTFCKKHCNQIRKVMSWC